MRSSESVNVPTSYMFSMTDSFTGNKIKALQALEAWASYGVKNSRRI